MLARLLRYLRGLARVKVAATLVFVDLNLP